MGVTGGVEAAVAVLSRLASGMRGVHAAWSSTFVLLWCRDRRWVGGGRRRLSALAGGRSSSHR